MKRILLIMALASVSVLAKAEDIKITTLKYVGPFAMQQPFMVDETDVNNKKYSAETLIDTPLPLTDVFASTQADLKGNDGLTIPKSGSDHALHLLGFTLQNNRYGKAKITVDGLKKYQLFVDGVKSGPDSLTLEPGTHQVVIKALTGKDAEKVKVNVATTETGLLKVTDQKAGRNILLTDILHGKRYSGVSLSPNGKYLITSYSETLPGGDTEYSTKISELATGRIIAQGEESTQWMPRSSKYCLFRKSSLEHF